MTEDERLEAARAEVLAGFLRQCRHCGVSHPEFPSWWRRLLHWAGWWP